MSEKPLAIGELPPDARYMLIAAGKVGKSGSLARASAIQRAERIIEERYPQYLKQKED